MIDVKELRIGNYLFDKIENRFVEISGTSTNGEHNWVYIEKVYFELKEEGITCGSFQGYFAMHFEPIPLTPEILVQCGFMAWDDKKTYEKEFKSGSKINIRGTEVFLGGYDSCTDGHGFITEIKYLHQFQNLYYDLTGEELKVNLNHTAPSQLH